VAAGHLAPDAFDKPEVLQLAQADADRRLAQAEIAGRVVQGLLVGLKIEVDQHLADHAAQSQVLAARPPMSTIRRRTSSVSDSTCVFIVYNSVNVVNLAERRPGRKDFLWPFLSLDDHSGLPYAITYMPLRLESVVESVPNRSTPRFLNKVALPIGLLDHPFSLPEEFLLNSAAANRSRFPVDLLALLPWRLSLAPQMVISHQTTGHAHGSVTILQSRGLFQDGPISSGPRTWDSDAPSLRVAVTSIPHSYCMPSRL